VLLPVLSVFSDTFNQQQLSAINGKTVAAFLLSTLATIPATVLPSKNFPYYITAALLFVLFKSTVAFSGNIDCRFLLEPTDRLLSFITNSSSVYLSGKGYYHSKLNILIEKSCSGVNFWLLCFLMLAFLAVKYVEKPLYKVLSIPVTLALAYLVTILVNASRIFASVIMQQQADHFLPHRPHLILHELVGIITNLVFLILLYYFSEKFLNNRLQHAKFIKS